MIAAAAPSVKSTSGHEPPKARTSGGSASDAEHHPPDDRHHHRCERRDHQRDADGGRDDLAPAPAAEEQGPPMADQSGSAGNHRSPAAAGGKAERRGGRTLPDVQQRNGEEHFETGVAPDVRRPSTSAPDLAYVLPREEPREPVSPWETPEHVSGHPQKHNGQEAHPAILDAISETRPAPLRKVGCTLTR